MNECSGVMAEVFFLRVNGVDKRIRLGPNATFKTLAADLLLNPQTITDSEGVQNSMELEVRAVTEPGVTYEILAEPANVPVTPVAFNSVPNSPSSTVVTSPQQMQDPATAKYGRRSVAVTRSYALFVECEGGRHLTLLVHYHMFIWEVKDLIRDKTGTPIEHQKLTHEDVVLDDKAPLKDYKLLQRRTLKMEVKNGGG